MYYYYIINNNNNNKQPWKINVVQKRDNHSGLPYKYTCMLHRHFVAHFDKVELTWGVSMESQKISEWQREASWLKSISAGRKGRLSACSWQLKNRT